MAGINHIIFVNNQPVEFGKLPRKDGISDAVINPGVPFLAQVGNQAFGVPFRKILKRRIHHL